MTRKQYYTMIWEYEKRREKEWAKNGKSSTAAKNMSRKIKIWKQQIVRIDKRNNQIMAIGNAVTYFTGNNVKNSGGMQGVKKLWLARSIFYKYCLEKGIAGNFLREYTGDTSPQTPGRLRKSFTKSFSTHPDNRERYHRFKLYVKYLQENGSTVIEE